MPTYFISHISIAAREAKMKTRTRVWQPNILPQSRFSHWDTPSSFTLGFSDFSLKYQRFHCAKTRNARLSCAPNCKGPRFLNGKRSESSGPAEPALDRAASVRAPLDAHVAIPVDMLLRIPLEDIGAVPPNRSKARSWPSRRSSRPSRCRGGFLCGTWAGRC